MLQSNINISIITDSGNTEEHTMITCRVLDSKELQRYEYYLKNRNMDSRSIYFGYPASDEQIEELVSNMIANSDKHRVVVAEDSDLDIVGTIHIANISNTEVEFGVMVAEAYRGHGISSQMMEYALTWCRNRGLNDVYMHCLGYNKPIIHLVSKYGLEITREYGDADARVTLPTSNIFTFGTECLLRHQNAVQHNIRSFRKMLLV